MFASLALLASLAADPAAQACPPRAAAGPFAQPHRVDLQEDQEEDQEEAKPDDREVVAELLDQLSDHSRDRKGEDDATAVGLVDALLQEFPESGPKDRADIVEGVAEVVTFRRQADEEGRPREALKIAAATALGRMGPESGDALIGLVDHRSLGDAVTAHGAVLKSLGRVHPEKGVEPLLDMLKSHINELTAAAAIGLAGYREADQKVRKEIFEELLKVIIPLEDALVGGENASAEYAETRERYDAIAAPVRDTLQAMSGSEERDFHALRSWWNDNKKKDWDALRTG